MPALLLPCPYITPSILLQASTGISWETIPSRNSSPAQQQAEQWNICRRATSMIDVEANQRMRATISTETLRCPDYRVTINSGPGTANIILGRKPVLEVLSGQIAAAAPPLQYQAIPSTAFVINQPSPGIYGAFGVGDAAESGQSITLAGGYVSWLNGRFGQFLQVTYVSGYPVTSLTTDAAAGATTLTVDDTTGWAPVTTAGPGASGSIYDAGNEETINVTATSAMAGAGQVLLSAPTGFAHQAGTLISALPTQLMQAAILFAVSQALVRGATATGIQTMSGGVIRGDTPEYYASEAELLVRPYRRTT